MKKAVEYLLLFIALYPALFVGGIFANADYAGNFYWLEILLIEAVGSGIYLYFKEINPRRHVMIIPSKSAVGIVLRAVGFALSVLAWVSLGMALALLIPDGTPVKLLLTVLWGLLLLLLVYLFYFRGVSFYRNGKLRVFNLKIATYPNGTVEDVRIEPCGKSARLTVLVDGHEHVFFVPMRESYQYRSRLLGLREETEDTDRKAPDGVPQTRTFQAKVIDVRCFVTREGTKIPRVIRHFVIVFEDGAGQNLSIEVDEELYDGFAVGQSGTLTLIDGKVAEYILDF